MAFPDETAGVYIDKNAAQVDMVRTPGRKATAPLLFSGAEGTLLASPGRMWRASG